MSTNLRQLQGASLNTPTALGVKASQDIAASMNAILADVFTLYLKTKNTLKRMFGSEA